MAKITIGQGPTDDTSDVPVEEQIERNIADLRVPTKVRERDGDGPATGDPDVQPGAVGASGVAESPDEAPGADGGDREPGAHSVVVPEYDPAKYNVAEVNAYLESLSSDSSQEAEDEYDRVIEAERAGKKRSGILE